MHYLKSILITLLFFCFSANAAPSKKEINQILLQLQKVYDQTSNFEAHFEQKYHQKIFKKIDESQGQIRYQKPGKLRWDYEKPHQKSFIIESNSLWIYQPEDKLVYVNKCFKQDGLTASIAFLWGEGKIQKLFEASWLEEPLGDPADHKIVLTPKEKNSVFRQLILLIDPKTYRIKQSIVIDLGGNRNQFIFSKARFNQKIPPVTFKPVFSKEIKIMPIPGSCTK